MLAAMLPLATSLLPGTQGTVSPSHQYCEEVLAKQPAATGGHIWIRISKEGLSTQQARAAIARAAVVDVTTVGFAGRRDRVGRCIQWFSVEAEKVDNPGALRRAGTQGKMKVLDITASHKPVSEATVSRLRYQVRIKGGNRDGGYRKARQVLDALRRGGLPNYIPLVRLGADQVLARWGRMLCQGRPLPRQVRASGVDPGRCLRAWQDQLFDRYLASRVEDGLLGQCLPGELVINRSDEIAVVADAVHGQKRMDSWEIVALGPLYGEGMQSAANEAAAREMRILTAHAMQPHQVQRLRGGRRTVRVQPTSVLVDIQGEDLNLSCELPVDCHLSSLIDEVLKTPATPDQLPAPDDAQEPEMPALLADPEADES